MTHARKAKDGSRLHAERALTRGAHDQIAYALLLMGPMTLEDLALWLRRDNYAVNSNLNSMRRFGDVAMVEKGQHRNSRGMRCGKWTLTEKMREPIKR